MAAKLFHTKSELVRYKKKRECTLVLRWGGYEPPPLFAITAPFYASRGEWLRAPHSKLDPEIFLWRKQRNKQSHGGWCIWPSLKACKLSHDCKEIGQTLSAEYL